MKLAFDIDDTIVQGGTFANHYYDATPIPEMVELVNMLHDEGHEIFLFTSRGFGHDQLEQEYWLKTVAGIKFDHCYLGKPLYDLFVDDKAVSWNNGLTKESLAELMNRIKEFQNKEQL